MKSIRSLPQTGGHVLTLMLFLACLTESQARSAIYPIPPHQRARIEKAAPDQAAVSPEHPRKVLIWITPPHLMEKDPHKGYCIPFGIFALETLGRKTGAYEPVVSDDLTMFFPENIRQFDAIVMNNSSGPWITPTDADMERTEFRAHGNSVQAVELVLRQSLTDYLAQGGGLVGIHYAIGANRQWNDFPTIWGASYNGHPWNEEIGVSVDAPHHPLTSPFNAHGFRVADEIYQFKDPYSREDLDVLISLDTNRTNMKVPWIHRQDGDFALAWTKPFGQGRVFYTALGHRTEIYWNPAILRFYLNGIQFATGDLGVTSKTKPLLEVDLARQGFEQIFNGKDLSEWEGDLQLWSVKGAITGQTTEETRIQKNQFLIWKGGQPGDFELRCRFRLLGGNSGIYFHAEKQAANFKGDPLVGPQADFSADHRWTGVLMEYLKREILGERGQKVLIDTSGKKSVVGSVGDPAELLKAVRDGDWNDYRVLVQGPRTVLEINGVVMCEVLDHDPKRTPKGLLALQVHTGPPMTVQFKDIWIKQ